MLCLMRTHEANRAQRSDLDSEEQRAHRRRSRRRRRWRRIGSQAHRIGGDAQKKGRKEQCASSENAGLSKRFVNGKKPAAMIAERAVACRGVLLQ
jgi:hypothetical protein